MASTYASNLQWRIALFAIFSAFLSRTFNKLAILLCFLLPVVGIAQGGRIIEHTILVDTLERTYFMYAPEAYDGSQNWPVIFNLHASGGNAELHFERGMPMVADTAHFLIVYPRAFSVSNPVSGTFEPIWNELQIPELPSDVAFLDLLIDEIITDYAVDPSRVYVSGMSQGGAMAYILACAIPEKIAAMASVSGTATITAGTSFSSPGLTIPQTEGDCTPGVPMPLLHIHGTEDFLVPFRGGPGLLLRGLFLPDVTEHVGNWVSNALCSAEVQVTDLPNLDGQDGSNVTLIQYNGCSPYTTPDGINRNTEVWFYRINGGGHTWPGEPDIPGGLQFILGKPNRDINANVEIWNFFNRHRAPSPTAGNLSTRLQLIHTAPGQTVSVAINGEVIRPYFAYRTATPYFDVPAGIPLEFTFTSLETNEQEQFQTTLDPNKSYIAMVEATIDSEDDFPFGLSIFDQALESGLSKDQIDVLFFNGGPDAPGLDVFEQGQIRFSSTPFSSFSPGYISFPAEKQTLTLQPAASQMQLSHYEFDLGFWRGRTAVLFTSGLLSANQEDFELWVALSNGGTFALKPADRSFIPPTSSRQALLIPKLTIRPTYTTGTYQVEFQAPIPSTFQWTVQDLHGKPLKSQTLGIQAKGSHQFSLDLQSYPAGHYHLIVQSDQGFFESRLITKME